MYDIFLAFISISTTSKKCTKYKQKKLGLLYQKPNLAMPSLGKIMDIINVISYDCHQSHRILWFVLKCKIDPNEHLCPIE